MTRPGLVLGVALLAGCGGDPVPAPDADTTGVVNGEIPCVGSNAVPAAIQYTDCAPVVDPTAPACLGRDEGQADPGQEATRYPPNCHIVYPVCDTNFGGAYDCRCAPFSSGSDAVMWQCPI